ncbi:dystroglycan-related [Anaeramoeba flamelloides]|uniref:Dystroglycan-related n=1 Tax=Anaeramoeba flamelloides TaxID=1746091 RepID=A0AAV7ZVY2_9EUKA|nr:dystroglycan-related [Anaeramoeba flamelloides]
MRLQSLLYFSVFLLVINCSSFCPATRLGQQFEINSSQNGKQMISSLLRYSQGYFVSIWGTTDPTTKFDTLAGQLFLVPYSTTPEEYRMQFSLTNYTKGNEGSQCVAAVCSERFLVAWERQVADRWEVNGRLFEKNNVALNEEFVLTSNSNSHNRAPAIIILNERTVYNTGNSGSVSEQGTVSETDSCQAGAKQYFLVVWQSTNSSQSENWGISGQLLSINNDDGQITLLDQKYQFADLAGSNETNANTAYMEKGYFVVSWQSSSNQSKEGVISYAQMYKFDNHSLSISKIGEQFQISNDTKIGNLHLSIAFLAENYFVAAWQEYSTAVNNTVIKAQIYQYDFVSTPKMHGDEFIISEQSPEVENLNPTAKLLEDRMFVVIWETLDSSNKNMVYSQFYRFYENNQTILMNDRYQITNSVQEYPSYPTVELLKPQKLITSWGSCCHGDDKSYDIYGQAFNFIEPPYESRPLTNQIAEINKISEYTFPYDTFKDPQNGQLKYSTSTLPDWIQFEQYLRTFQFSLTRENCAGVFVIDVHALNECKQQANGSFSVTFNRNPPFVNKNLTNQTVHIKGPITYTIPDDTFEEPYLDTLALRTQLANGSSLPSWITFNKDSHKYSFNTKKGQCPEDITIDLIAENHCQLSASASFLLSTFLYPIIESPIDNVLLKADQEFTFTIPKSTFIDPENYTVSFDAILSNDQNLPDWIHFDHNSFVFTGMAPNTNTKLNISCRVKRCNHYTSSSFELTVSKNNSPAKKFNTKLFLAIFLPTLTLVIITVSMGVFYYYKKVRPKKNLVNGNYFKQSEDSETLNSEVPLLADKQNNKNDKID